jgi:hypothetical protein
LDIGGVVWIIGAAMNLETIYPVLMDALDRQISDIAIPYDVGVHSGRRTWGGPRIVPFQLLIIISSPSARP